VICTTCDGKHGWWVNARGVRIIGVPWPTQAAKWVECPDCLAGEVSCCDGLQAQPGPEDKT
jgi:hypothetical protein